MSTDRRKPSQHIYCSGFWVRVNGPGKPSAWRASQWKPSSQCSSTSWAAQAPPPGASLLGVRAPLSVSGPNLTFVCRGGGCGARSRFPPWRSKSPHAGRNPPHGDTPCFQWTPGPRTPRGLPLPVHTLRWRAGGRAREAPGPQAKNKGAGATPRPAPPTASRAPSPAHGPREMAAAVQNGSRVGRGAESRHRGQSSFPRCPCALRALEPQGKELGRAPHPRWPQGPLAQRLARHAGSYPSEPRVRAPPPPSFKCPRHSASPRPLPCPHASSLDGSVSSVVGSAKAVYFGLSAVFFLPIPSGSLCIPLSRNFPARSGTLRGLPHPPRSPPRRMRPAPWPRPRRAPVRV